MSQYPEFTGFLKKRGYNWEDKKLLSAGTKLSTNSLYNDGPITRETIGSMAIKYRFELIPDTQSVRDAGYTDEMRSMANVWYCPTADSENFYYTAFFGNIVEQQASTILVCRKRKNGDLVYAVNTKDYDLDTSDTNVNISRVSPALTSDTLYICNCAFSAVGPQLYSIDKLTGKLNWAIAYDPPNGLSPITKSGDYSYLNNTNAGMGDLNINVLQCHDRTVLVCGTSSLQNIQNWNIGLRRGELPFYTDQGRLTVIEDKGSYGEVLYGVDTCVENLEVGDVVVKGASNPIYDPFLPDLDYTVIATQAVDKVVNPYFFTPGQQYIPFNPAFGTNGYLPVAAAVNLKQGVTVTPVDIQQAYWQTAAGPFYIGGVNNNGNPTPFNTFNDLLVGLSDIALTMPEETRVVVIYSYVSISQREQLLNQLGNSGLFYYKLFLSGDVVNSIYDANGFGFWGNSVWGAQATYHEGKLYFGTGQAHSMPFLDAAYYNSRPESFLNLTAVIDAAANDYIANPTQENLDALNEAKKVLANTMRFSDSIPRSPRGQRSYSDAVFSVDFKTGNVNWVTRTVDNDTFSFLVERNPILLTTGLNSNIDGDVSSGIMIYSDCNSPKYLGVSPKSGLAFTLIEETGYPIKSAYLAPYGILGGANYQATTTGGRSLITFQSNSALGEARVNMITDEGVVIPDFTSFVCSYDVYAGVVIWLSILDGQGFSQVAQVNGVILTPSNEGILYGLSTLNGEILMRFDAKAAETGSGGIGAPCVLDKLIIWTPSYRLYPVGMPGKYGATYTVEDQNDTSLDCLLSSYYIGKKLSHHQKGLVVSAGQKWRREDCKIITKLYFLIGGVKSKVCYQVEETKCNKLRFKEISCEGIKVCVSVEDCQIYCQNSYYLCLKIGSSVVKMLFNRK